MDDGRTLDDMRFSSEDIDKSKQNKTEYFTNVRERTGLLVFLKRRRVVVLVALGVVLFLTVAFVVLSILLASGGNKPASDEVGAGLEAEELLTDEVTRYLYDDEYAGTYEELVGKINAFIEESGDDADSVVRVKIVLSRLYMDNGDAMLAIDVLTGALNESGVSEENQVELLMALVRVYERTKQTPELIDVLGRLVALPDNIQLEGQDWAFLREMYAEQLKGLEEGQ